MTEHRPSFYDWSRRSADGGPSVIPFIEAVRSGRIPVVGFTDDGLSVVLDTYNNSEHPVTGCTAHEIMELRAMVALAALKIDPKNIPA